MLSGAQASRRLLLVVSVMLSVVASPRPAAASSAMDLPPSLRGLPMDRLLALFEVSFETPSIAAEIARHRAFIPPTVHETEMCDGLARVIREYPHTSDARRALLDIGGVYARMGDWRSAEAPFRFVMEMKAGKSEARIAHFRLVQMYRYAGVPTPVDPVAECRAAVHAYEGTPEEGLGRMLLGSMLAERAAFEEAFAEFERVIGRFANQPYTSYARIQYALALVRDGACEQAREVLAPVLTDPVWSGRAYLARAAAYECEGNTDMAIADYRRAAETADSVWIRGQACFDLGHLYASENQRGPARQWLKAGLATVPWRPGRLDIRLEILSNLYASGLYLEAAEAAVELEMYVLNAPERYSEEELTETVRLCEDTLDRCEKRLSVTECQ